jgi:DNA-binding XRE family transcriptional regulator
MKMKSSPMTATRLSLSTSLPSSAIPKGLDMTAQGRRAAATLGNQAPTAILNSERVAYRRVPRALPVLRAECHCWASQQRQPAASLTQVKLAKLAGIRPETLNRLEQGKHTPSMETINKIDRALNKAGRGKDEG